MKLTKRLLEIVSVLEKEGESWRSPHLEKLMIQILMDSADARVGDGPHPGPHEEKVLDLWQEIAYPPGTNLPPYEEWADINLAARRVLKEFLLSGLKTYEYMESYEKIQELRQQRSEEWEKDPRYRDYMGGMGY